MEIPRRQIRAVYDDDSITVYQAYSPAIAIPAAADNRFGAGFKRSRMTWIKPSFRWMMYRCGWATKPGQEHVLAIRIERAGFEWALQHSAFAHRSLQIGLSGEAVARYCDEWIREIRDVTDLARECHAQLLEQDPDTAAKLLPAKRPYPVPPLIAARIGMQVAQ